MPQQTNLNVEPYFDDFESTNDYHRVLFKPGYPVQARELTTLQSILQDQVEKFGQHFFKEGSKVIPGNTGYSQLYYCVQLNATHLGIPVSSYMDQLIGSKITGQTSGVSAYVDFVLPAEQSERENITLYINYISSSTENNSTQIFLDGEELISNQLITSTLFGNPFIQEGTPFATTFAEDSTATGSVFQIESGVYFIRGNFVEVDREYLILDQYTDRPNYRVGLFINEEVITADIDESLNDNSQGFNNYSAPGADRLRITASLFKKPLNDFDDTNFIELAVIEDGVLRTNTNTSNSSIEVRNSISDTIANRSYIESGSFYTKPFEVTLEDSLDDKIGNRGLFEQDQFTPSGGTPSEDLAVYKISPGSALVRGYEVETTSPVMIDVQKPRTGKTLTNQPLSFNNGNTLILKKLYNSPTTGIGTSYHVSLRDTVVGSPTSEAGSEIGIARVYDFNLESNSYNTDPNQNEWGISLYDIDIFAQLTLNVEKTFSTPTFIRGNSSGATAFLVEDITNSNIAKVYGISGTFSVDESLTVDGIESGITISSIQTYKMSDVKSILSKDGGTVDFSADVDRINQSIDDSLFATVPNRNISSLNLDNSSITIRKTYTVDIVNNKITTNTRPSAGSGEVFLEFKPDRYTLIRSDGSIEELDFSNFKLSIDSKFIEIENLGSDDSGAKLITTIEKSSPSSKTKVLSKVDSIIIDKSKLQQSGIGAATLNDGLTSGDYPFGTRVQDEVISVNKPDIIKIHGVFESANITDPSSPVLSLSSLNTPSLTTSDLIIGERIVGQLSGSVAIVAEKISTNSSVITVLYKNENRFTVGEILDFKESGYSANLNSITSPSFDVSTNYTYSTGQEKTFYNYASIKRKTDVEEPTRRLRIYFSSASYDSADTGDITTVNSYQSFDYSKEIQSISGIRNTDIIDTRPRVSDYVHTPSTDRSPLEFYGRNFSADGNASKNILAPNEKISVDLSYYRGRIDSIFLTKSGKLQVKYGVESDFPERPDQVDGTLEIATVNIPPYLYDTRDVVINASDHKRYTMSDIKHLEDRIKNLEKFTTLSILESSTENLFIKDANNSNRFKSGFFVDDFTSFKSQDDSVPVNNSIDETKNELRPKHYTTSLGFMPGPVSGVTPGEDLSYSTIEGINVRKESNIITLDYSEIEWLSQSFATRTESVSPFVVSFWQGTIDLSPSSSYWVDVRRGDNSDHQEGFEPNVWNSWQKNWIGINPNFDSDTYSQKYSTSTSLSQEEDKESAGINNHINILKTKGSVGTGVQNKIVDKVNLSTKSTNIHFESKNIKPNTRMYAFFDGKDVSNYCVPKMLEITMIDGIFEVGETVDGLMISNDLDQKTSESAHISFRVAQANHKEGPYNSPTKIYREDQYTGRQIPEIYSSTSITLNVDTLSLSNDCEIDYHGWVEVGMVLCGRESGAQATVTNNRLVSDYASCLSGSLYIPDSMRSSNPRFESGEKVFTLTSDPDNDENLSTSIAESSYMSSGIIETVHNDIVSIRTPMSQARHEIKEASVRDTIDTEIVSGSSSQTSLENITAWYDPFAQAFTVEDDHGIFVTRCDVYFRSKDVSGIPIEIQIRPMKNGVPSNKIIPGSSVVLDPEEIQTSSDGSAATSFNFKSPVYLEGENTEYAICLKSNSTRYEVYVSMIGELDILSDSYISNLSYLGPLFKSQNTSNWEPSTNENLKFSLYRADFLDSGSVEFYNPELKVTKLMPDSLAFSSKKLSVGLSTHIGGSTVMDSYALDPGRKYKQENTNAHATLISKAAEATGSLTVTSAGSGYGNAASLTDADLTAITGNGRDAKATITLSSGEVSAATITSGGYGYNVGDVVGISTTGTGIGARLTVATIGNINQLIFDNIQGEFLKNATTNKLLYVKDDGTSSDVLGDDDNPVYLSEINSEYSDGLHVKVNHKNHGMHSTNNVVELFGVQPDSKPTKLSVAYSSSSTASISVDDSSQFAEFENASVGTNNTGYILIEDEIIEYTSVSGNQLIGIARRVEDTISKTYPVGTPVYKYENNGISLRRINRAHDFSDVSDRDRYPITFDSYYIKINTQVIYNPSNDDRSDDTTFAKLFARETKTSGGYEIKASQNIPFEVITPNIHNLTVDGTNLSGQIKTTTGQSQSGSEVPFLTPGFEEISINKPNYLNSPRIICSKVNEDTRITASPGSKSANLRLFLSTTNSKLSPVIDSERVSMIFTSNRINNIITDYVTDDRVNRIFTDPTACQYISKEMDIESKASALKIILNGDLSKDNEIRAFYAISENKGFDPVFTPFPGKESKYDGTSDKKVEKSAGYREYEFTADNLPDFRCYKIKIIMTSNSQVDIPKIRDLKVIALA